MVRQKAKARGRPREKTKEPEYLYDLGVAVMTKVRAQRAAERWRKALVRARRYNFPKALKVTEHMEAALDAMQKAVRALERVPEGWKPAVGAVGNSLFEVNSTVQIREKNRRTYPYVSDPSAPFKVTAIYGPKIAGMVASQTGEMTAIFPRAHLQLVHAETADA